MAVGLFGTGVSALLTSQRALATTSQNISNVNTEGYNRQRVNLTATDPQAFGGGYIGTGVQISSIERLYDKFLTEQVRNNTSSFNQFDKLYSLASQVDDLLADPQLSISGGLNEFFNSLQQVADDPASTANRQVLLGTAQTLSEKFQFLDQRLDDLRKSINTDLTTQVTDLNSISKNIAELNRSISDIRAVGNGEPNDLLDQRDLYLKKLSEIVNVNVVEQDDGLINVFIGTGQPLVTGFESRELVVQQDPFDAQNVFIGIELSAGTVDVTQQLSGGIIGGLLQARDEAVNQAQDAIGYLAVGLSSTFNAQHRQGMDLTGSLGGDFFTPIAATTAQVLPNMGNTGIPTADITVAVTDVNNSPISSYRLDRAGATYTLTRLSDNTAFTLATFPGASEQVDGIRLTLNSGTIADGDSFMIHPFRNAAEDFSVAITNTDKIAAAGPVRTSASISNIGAGSISDGKISNFALYDGDTYTLTFTNSTTYEVRDSASNLEVAGAYTSGSTITFNGIDIAISGSPSTGDSFTIEPNTNGSGDNRNALNLIGLKDSKLLSSNTNTFSESYGQLVVGVGTRTRQSEISRNAQENMLEQSVAARESKSGVNLDEEAADLLFYQQMYQAATRIIATADSTFQSLIDIMRR